MFLSMVARLFAMLIVVLAQVPLGHAAVEPARDRACGDTSCHEVVVETTCCGQHIERVVCERSGGACQCGARMPDEPEPRPTAPLPTRSHESLRAVVTSPGVVVIRTPVDALAPAVLALAKDVGLQAGHRAIRARTCNWRT